MTGNKPYCLCLNNTSQFVLIVCRLYSKCNLLPNQLYVSQHSHIFCHCYTYSTASPSQRPAQTHPKSSGRPDLPTHSTLHGLTSQQPLLHWSFRIVSLVFWYDPSMSFEHFPLLLNLQAARLRRSVKILCSWRFPQISRYLSQTLDCKKSWNRDSM